VAESALFTLILTEPDAEEEGDSAAIHRRIAVVEKLLPKDKPLILPSQSDKGSRRRHRPWRAGPASESVEPRAGPYQTGMRALYFMAQTSVRQSHRNRDRLEH